MHLLDDTCLFGHRLHCPLHTTLAISAVKTFTFRVAWAFEEKVHRMRGRYVFFDAAYKVLGQGNIAIFVAFALYNVQQAAVKIKML